MSGGEQRIQGLRTTDATEPGGTRRLIRAVLDLSMARDIEHIRAIVRTAAREMVNADGATFVLRDHDVCHYVDEDAIAPLWKGQRFPMSACISGWAMINRKPATVPDIFFDPRIPVDAYRPTFVRSLVMVPIREADPIGAIGTYWSAAHEPSATTVELLQALANSTAVAMENVRVYHELEDRVQRRTAELEAANQELEAFSYSVSHDLRAPLRHARGYAEALRDEAYRTLSADGRHYLDEITSSTDRMSQLIDDLLAFARLGRTPLRMVPVQIGAIIAEAREEAMRDATGRVVEWHIDATAPVVHGDRALLKQVLVNLFANAVKYTRGRESARVDVALRQTGQALEVRVRDNGIGFDPRYADRLFRVFQRLHRSCDFEGTGVGLANVRRIVGRHGGHTWASGQPDQGAEFGFSLPLRGGEETNDGAVSLVR